VDGFRDGFEGHDRCGHRKGRIGFASGYFGPHSMGSLDIPFESSSKILDFPNVPHGKPRHEKVLIWEIF